MFDQPSPEDHLYKDIYQRDEAPPHPGEILREDLIPRCGLNRAAVAKRLGISKQKLADVLAERAPVTADLAMRFAALFGFSPRYWLGLQMQHDWWVIQQSKDLPITPIDWKRARGRKGASAKQRTPGYR